MLSPSVRCATVVYCPGAFAKISTGTSESPVSHPEYVPVAVKLVTALSRCAPPSASMYFANTPSIWLALLPLATMNSSEFGLSTGSPYWIDMFGTFCGTDVFEWHVKQLTRFWLPKKLRLMVFIMPTMNRAFWIMGVSMANASGFPSRICGEWQPVQSFEVAAANIPIVSMNSSIGIPLSTRMSLKKVSDIRGASVGTGAAWRAATAMLVKQISPAASRRMRDDFMESSGFSQVLATAAQRHRERKLFLCLCVSVARHHENRRQTAA